MSSIYQQSFNTFRFVVAATWMNEVCVGKRHLPRWEQDRP
jgi:hypothetical protein